MKLTDNRRHLRRVVVTFMPPSLNPVVADLAPCGPDLTVYDEEHGITYLRMLDAAAEGADWREVSLIVLHIDPAREPDRARRAFDSPSVARQMDDIDWVPAIVSARVAVAVSVTSMPEELIHPSSI